jgi:hypothetical protein
MQGAFPWRHARQHAMRGVRAAYGLRLDTAKSFVVQMGQANEKATPPSASGAVDGGGADGASAAAARAATSLRSWSAVSMIQSNSNVLQRHCVAATLGPRRHRQHMNRALAPVVAAVARRCRRFRRRHCCNATCTTMHRSLHFQCMRATTHSCMSVRLHRKAVRRPVQVLVTAAAARSLHTINEINRINSSFFLPCCVPGTEFCGTGHASIFCERPHKCLQLFQG